MRKWLRDPVPEILEIPQYRRSDPTPEVAGISGISGKEQGVEDNLPSNTRLDTAGISRIGGISGWAAPSGVPSDSPPSATPSRKAGPARVIPLSSQPQPQGEWSPEDW